MNMAGLLNKDIISDFENSFRTNCLILIGEAYKWLKDTKNITVDWDEETILANIFTHIYENEKAIAWNINVSDECRLYHQAILNNKIRARSAFRIDLKLSTNFKTSKQLMTFVFVTICCRNDPHTKSIPIFQLLAGKWGGIYLVVSGDRDQVVKTTEIDSGQLVYNVSIQY